MYGRAIGETSVLDRKRQRPAFRAVPRQSAGSRYPARRCAAARIASLSRAAADIAVLPLHGMMTAPEPGEMGDDVE
jgi:hypothetical protein